MMVSDTVEQDGCHWHAHLNQILAFRFRDERLELGCGEGVDESGLGNDEE